MKLLLNSIIIFVQHVDRLKSFYVDKLHLEVEEEIEQEWVLLKAGECKVALHKAGEGNRFSDPGFKVNNNTKIVFEIDGDIFTQREILAAEKVAITEVRTFDNFDYWLCDGEDPEGNVFQLRQRKNETAIIT